MANTQKPSYEINEDKRLKTVVPVQMIEAGLIIKQKVIKNTMTYYSIPTTSCPT